MKILLFGGSEQVRRELQRSLAPLGTLLVSGQGALPRADLTDFGQLDNLVATLNRDVIVNAAAHVAVDKAETGRDALQMVNDQHDTPNGAAFLADNTRPAIQHLRQNAEISSLYHLVPTGETPWFGLAQYLLYEAQSPGLLIHLPELQAVSSAEFPQAAMRPLNSRLNTEKFRRVCGAVLRDWKVGIDSFLGILRNQTTHGLTEPEPMH